MKTKSLHRDKVNVITLGCSKNLVDSENLITQLKHADIHVEHESTTQDANIIIVNTCGFIDKAKEESINTIFAYVKEKQAGRIEKLYVTGCLSARYQDQLREEIPEVDDWFGTIELPGLLSKFKVDYKQDLIGERLITTPSHFAYVKISEGCNRTCSFCAIPLMRGNHVSRSMESLVQEVTQLARRGVKEIMLIAQELTYYGLDLYKKRMLPELLRSLCAIQGIEWIRLHYAYPSKFPLEIIEVMAEQPKICNYLDMPLQHVSDALLQSMRRQVTQSEMRALIQDIRSMNPDIALRTTFLVGYPGETEADIQELCTFLEEIQFERVGLFTYSHEEDTAAYQLKDNISQKVKEARALRVQEVQKGISLKKNQEKIGKTLRVIIDRKEDQVFFGRTEYDSPEVDNEVIIESPPPDLKVGHLYFCLITEAMDFDLIGNIIQEV